MNACLKEFLASKIFQELLHPSNCIYSLKNENWNFFKDPILKSVSGKVYCTNSGYMVRFHQGNVAILQYLICN